jgi:diacylglycerol kinase (ATP)
VPTAHARLTRKAFKPQCAVIYNPIKVDLSSLKKTVNAAAAAQGWAPPLWFSTTEEDMGQRVTGSAIRRGATLVFAAGGDGTVRAVAEALRDTDIALALIPSGTGNLLARNLDISVSSLSAVIGIGFSGTKRSIDLGVSQIVREGGHVEDHTFVVMAGLGLDAKMISNTNSRLKKAVGWLAYVDAGIRSIPEIKPVKVRYQLDEGSVRSMNVHTIIIGNCGTLPGGILLIPDAKPDDGLLNIVALQPRGPFGWIKVWNKVAWENGVFRKSALGRRIIDLTKDAKDLTYLVGADLQLWVDEPQQFQVDGDEFGEAISVRTRVAPSALTVMVPPTSARRTAATAVSAAKRSSR